MIYDPRTDKFPYPEDTAGHYITIRKDDGTVFDSDYPYVDDSRGARFIRMATRILLNVIVFPVARIRLGLRIKGRENLKKHRETLKGGVISCANHVHFWDYIAIMRGVRPFRPFVAVWDRNIRGENGKMMRAVGGIPVPSEDIHATASFMKSVKGLLDGGWLHIYSEGSMWEYYCPIRPFKDGAAYLACKYGKPILPLAFSYREPGWVRKKIFHQIALFTLHIGEPLFVNEELPRCERQKDLLIRSHEAVCRLSGIDPAKNPYPPVYDRSVKTEYETLE